MDRLSMLNNYLDSYDRHQQQMFINYIGGSCSILLGEDRWIRLIKEADIVVQKMALKEARRDTPGSY